MNKTKNSKKNNTLIHDSWWFKVEFMQRYNMIEQVICHRQHLSSR